MSDSIPLDKDFWRYVHSAYRNKNGYAVLTENKNVEAGAIWLKKDLVKYPFEIQFAYKAGGGTGGDGFIFMFYAYNRLALEDWPYYKDTIILQMIREGYDLPKGGGLGFLGPGYGVKFDSHPKGQIAIIKDDVDNNLASVNSTKTEDFEWHLAMVRTDRSGIEVSVDHEKILKWKSDSEWSSRMITEGHYPGLGFAAATGSLNNWHIIAGIAKLDVDIPAHGLISVLELWYRI